MEDDQFVMTVVGGDYLTAARMRGAQRIRGNSENSGDRFDGLLPVAEDWHAKVCLLEVNCLYTIYLRVNFLHLTCTYYHSVSN